MSILNVRTKFHSLEDAVYYAGSKGWNSKITEKDIDGVMEWVNIYKYLSDLRYLTNSFSRDNPDLDYRNVITILHDKLLKTLTRIDEVYAKYYVDQPNLPTLPNGDYEPEAHREYMLNFKVAMDYLLYHLGVVFNRIKIIRKIIIDKGMEVPDLPRQTLRRLKDVFQHYPAEFVDLE